MNDDHDGLADEDLLRQMGHRRSFVAGVAELTSGCLVLVLGWGVTLGVFALMVWAAVWLLRGMGAL